ncbi:MAG: hypothetical protein H0W62_11730 [Chitinophagales bacterium]|nr:hypothetical protein [Chitinophagales bacterium]
MRNVTILFSGLLLISSLYSKAQLSNTIFTHIALVDFSDWSGNYSVETGLDYRYSFKPKITAEGNFNYYHTDISDVVLNGIPNNGAVYNRTISEISIDGGYAFTLKNKCLQIIPSAGLTYRFRHDDYVQNNRVDSFINLPYPPFIPGTIKSKDLGWMAGLNIDYHITQWLLLGIYGNRKRYDAGPNSFSMGLRGAFLFNFIYFLPQLHFTPNSGAARKLRMDSAGP